MRDEDNVSRVAVNICNEEYIIKGSDSPEHIERIARMVDKKMRELSGKANHLSKSNLAVLAALNLADELVKLQSDYDNLVKMIDEEKG